MSDDAIGRIPAQRSAPAMERACRCGHGAETHEHFRAGSDCAVCDCPRFRSAGLAEHLTAVLGRRR
jgi:hypothetical protein